MCDVGFIGQKFLGTAVLPPLWCGAVYQFQTFQNLAVVQAPFLKNTYCMRQWCFAFI